MQSPIYIAFQNFGRAYLRPWDHHVAASTCSVPPHLSHCLFSIHHQDPAGLFRRIPFELETGFVLFKLKYKIIGLVSCIQSRIYNFIHYHVGSSMNIIISVHTYNTSMRIKAMGFNDMKVPRGGRFRWCAALLLLRGVGEKSQGRSSSALAHRRSWLLFFFWACISNWYMIISSLLNLVLYFCWWIEFFLFWKVHWYLTTQILVGTNQHLC